MSDQAHLVLLAQPPSPEPHPGLADARGAMLHQLLGGFRESPKINCLDHFVYWKQREES